MALDKQAEGFENQRGAFSAFMIARKGTRYKAAEEGGYRWPSQVPIRVFQKKNDSGVPSHGTHLLRLPNGKYQLVRIIPQSIEERNDNIRALRERLYCQISDHLKSDYDEAVAREADNVEGLRQRWLASKDKIRADNPYIKGD